MNVLSTLALIIAALCALAVTSASASQSHSEGEPRKPIHVGAVVFPEHGHFAPLTAVLQACVDRGDSVTLYTPAFFIPAEVAPGVYSCGPQTVTEEEARASGGRKVTGGTITYVSMGNYSYDAFDDAFFVRLVEAHPTETIGEVNENMAPFMAWFTRSLLAHFNVDNGARPDVFFVDYGCNNAAFVAELLKIPTVISWPMTLTFPYNTHTHVPFMSLGFSAETSLGERWLNTALYLLARAIAPISLGESNALRAEIGLPPADVYHMLYRNAVLTPSIFGFEINQPLCPNVFPVGMLLPAMNGTIDDEFKAWLDNDCDRLVYINMGSVAVLPQRWDNAILNASIAFANGGEQQRTCVVWKRRTKGAESAAPDSAFSSPAAKARLRIIRTLPFSPRLLLKYTRANTEEAKAPLSKLFVTHCGDTSVFESIESHVPMVGIPLFADQPNVCARVRDGNVGTFIDKNSLSQEALVNAVEGVFAEETEMVARLRFMHQTARAQGLAPRAAEVLHFIAELGFEGAKALNCKHVDEPWYRVYDVDVMVGLSLILWSLIIFGFYFCRCCLCRTCRRSAAPRGAAQKRKQKVE